MLKETSRRTLSPSSLRTKTERTTNELEDKLKKNSQQNEDMEMELKNITGLLGKKEQQVEKLRQEFLPAVEELEAEKLSVLSENNV